LPALAAVVLSPEAGADNQFNAHGEGSLVDLSALDPLPDRVVLQVSGGGTILNTDSKTALTIRISGWHTVKEDRNIDIANRS